MRSSIISIIVGLSLFSCKIITLDDEQITGSIPEDIELITIPAGAYSSGEHGIEKYIEYDYEIMKYPVTNAQYIEYLKNVYENGKITITSQTVTGYYSGDKNWPSGIYEFVDFNDSNCRIGFNPTDQFWIGWNWVNGRKGGYDNHPITEVTWFGAIAFAKFYGMKLPSKEEWEKAARANTSYIFPWGNDFDSTKINYKHSGDIYDNDTTPVGFYDGANNTSDSHSPYGLYDMSGNVWEWTNSWKDQSPGKVLKGGSWNTLARKGSEHQFYELSTWFEPNMGYSPNNSSHDIGFRCIKLFE